MKRVLAIPPSAIALVAAIALATPAFAQINIPSNTSDGYLFVNNFSHWTKTATQPNLNSLAPPFGNVRQGDPSILTWGYVPDGTAYDTSFSSLVLMLDAAIGVGPGGSSAPLSDRPWHQHFKSAFDRWDELSGLTMNYVSYDDGAAAGSTNSPGVLNTRADMRIGAIAIDGPSNQLGAAYLPNGGDMNLDTGDSAFFGGTANNYLNLRQFVMHEVGHGLGLNHWVSNNSNALLEPFFSSAFQGPQHSDILGIHRAYGDKFESGTGNNTYQTATPLGNVSTFTGIGFDGDNAIVALTDVDFVSIDGSSDRDFYSILVGSAGNLSIALDALGLSYQIEEQGGANSTTVDTSMMSNLALSLFGIDGTTLLTTADANGIGGSETISDYFLDPGTYYIRVASTTNEAQFYSLTTSFTAIPEPSHALLLSVFCTASLLHRRRRAIGS